MAAETDNEKVFTICMMIIAGAVIDVPLRFRLDTRAFISFEIYATDGVRSGARIA